MTDDEITEHIVRMVEQVEKDEANRNAFSIGEQIAIALILDRADWLKDLGWTILGAIDGLGGNGSEPHSARC